MALHRASPLAVLGLRPGASCADIDEAYRRLIKQHHPDLPGGDRARAAELNRAYASLKRKGGAERPQVAIATPPPVRPARRLGWRVPVALGAAVAGAMLVPLPKLPAPAPRHGAPAPRNVAIRLAEDHAIAPPGLPDEAAVASGVAEALRLARQGSGPVLAYSKACGEDVRRYPGAALVDHCLAFDTAAAELLKTPADAPHEGATRAAEARRDALRLVRMTGRDQARR